MTHLETEILRIWLTGESTSTILRYARRLGSTMTGEDQILALAEAAGVDWYPIRAAAREERNREDMRRAYGLTDDEIIDIAMDNYGSLPAEAADALRVAAEKDGREPP